MVATGLVVLFPPGVLFQIAFRFRSADWPGSSSFWTAAQDGARAGDCTLGGGCGVHAVGHDQQGQHWRPTFATHLPTVVRGDRLRGGTPSPTGCRGNRPCPRLLASDGHGTCLSIVHPVFQRGRRGREERLPLSRGFE